MQNPELNTVPVTEYPHEPALGQAQSVSLVSDLKTKLFAVVINILVLVEVFVAMYVAQQTPARLTPVFFKIFFTLLLPTLVLAYVGRRVLAKVKP